MLLQEFTNLTGFTPTADYFNRVIHPAYMESDLDKEAWCKQWKKKGGIQEAYDAQCKMVVEIAAECEQHENAVSRYMGILHDRNTELASLREVEHDLRKHKSELQEQVATLTEERMEVAAYLIAMAVKFEIPNLADQAIEMIGERAYLAYKVKHNIKLTPRDCEWIIAALNVK